MTQTLVRPAAPSAPARPTRPEIRWERWLGPLWLWGLLLATVEEIVARHALDLSDEPGATQQEEGRA